MTFSKFISYRVQKPRERDRGRIGVSHSCVHKESSVGERTQWMIMKKSGFIIIHMCVHVRVHVIVVVFFFAII